MLKEIQSVPSVSTADRNKDKYALPRIHMRISVDGGYNDYFNLLKLIEPCLNMLVLLVNYLTCSVVTLQSRKTKALWRDKTQ